MLGSIDLLTEFSKVTWKEFTQMKAPVDKILANSKANPFQAWKRLCPGLGAYTGLEVGAAASQLPLPPPSPAQRGARAPTVGGAGD